MKTAIAKTLMNAKIVLAAQIDVAKKSAKMTTSLMTTKMTELDTFISGKSRNAWVNTEKFNVYLRKGWRILGNERFEALDIATVSIINLSERGQGHFTKLLAEIVEKCPFDFIYVENVQEERFAKFFERNGWTRDARLESDYCYYKRVK